MVIYTSVVQTLTRGPYSARGQFCAARERFCVPYITHSHNYIALATQPLHITVTHH